MNPASESFADNPSATGQSNKLDDHGKSDRWHTANSCRKHWLCQSTQVHIHSHRDLNSMSSTSDNTLSRSRSSLSFRLSLSLFSPVVSCCIFVGLCHLVSLCVTHARTLVLWFSLFFCLSLSLSFPLSLSLSIYPYIYVHARAGSLHATSVVWLRLR